MNEKKEKPWSVGGLSKGSNQEKVTKNNSALISIGQVEKIAYVIALTPYCELLPAALIVSFVMGAI